MGGGNPSRTISLAVPCLGLALVIVQLTLPWLGEEDLLSRVTTDMRLHTWLAELSQGRGLRT